MTIAGSDSGGGAGIQADLKTFSALGVYGSSTLTAITAQNTVGVTMVHEIPIDIIVAQIDAVLSDIGADAVKTGMLASRAIVETVAEEMERHQVRRLVVDPVMLSKSGAPLLKGAARQTLIKRLFPLTTLVTPNLGEASLFIGRPVKDLKSMEEAAKKIGNMGPKAVLIKGGHFKGAAVDVLFQNGTFRKFSAPWIPSRHTHGLGCTLSAAITAELAKGHALHRAIEIAKKYLTRAIAMAPALGKGIGPVNHHARY